MRLFGRNDLLLAGGLTIAAFVLFADAIAEGLRWVEALETARGLRLVPALIILAAVFIAHQFWKRLQVRAAAANAAAEARDAATRVAEMERLVAFGEALARSLNDDSIQHTTAAHIPLLAPGRGAWVLLRVGGTWQSLCVVGDGNQADRERIARKALGDGTNPVPQDDVCFPMVVAGTPVGVLGVAAEPVLTDHQRSILAAAAALLAVSLKNAELFRVVHENSVRDSLTGCFNRKHALEVIDAEMRRARRSQMPLSLLMLDLDHFKEINDRFGHLGGDAVLAAIGLRMKTVLRGSDLKCRYGGEEFLILLPDTPIAGARRVADTLRREIAANGVPWNGDRIPVTASFGVTGVAGGEVDPMAVIARADHALYRAKLDGRNCVRTADEPAAATRQQVVA
jgi:diguanylate cyclase (GGDEF)-like protein